MTQYYPAMHNEAQMLQINNSLFAENTARSQNEQQLFIAWQIAEAERKKMEEIAVKLQEQIKVMNLEIERLELNQKPRKTISQEVEVIEDEELAEDTKWIRDKVKNNKKKRKLADIKSPRQVKQAVDKTDTAAPIVHTKQTYKPPPIMVTGVKNLNDLTDLFKKLIGEEHFQTKLMNNGVNKINVTTESAYRIVTSELKKQNVSWYSYENKQTRDIKVMIKNIHHSFKPVNIIQDLRAQGLEALNATPKLKWKTKEPLDMFIVSFSKNVDINKVYNIKKVCNATVTVEPIKSNKLIPQCQICQSLGHTKNYCNKTPKCVKCAGSHLTADCEKPKELQPKCCNCGKNHPANYRGCEVIKELQRIRDNKNKPKQQTKQNKASGTIAKQDRPNNVHQTLGKTYSQSVAGSSHAIKQPKSTEDMLAEIMQMLTNQDLRLKKIESSIKDSCDQQ